MADNRPPKPLGYRPGETYIDMVTGQFKQVQAVGPDVVIPVAAKETVEEPEEQPKTEEKKTTKPRKVATAAERRAGTPILKKETPTPGQTPQQTVSAAMRSAGAVTPEAAASLAPQPSTGGPATTTTTTSNKTRQNRRRGKETAAPSIDVENLKQQYPGYSWVWDLSPEFNDTKQLWADYLNGTITGERFNNLLGQSSWYRNNRVVNETRRVKNRYGDILDGGSLAKIVNESITFQYEDEELDNAFFTSALSRNVITGEYVDSRAAKAALASNVANGYRNYAKSMFLSTDDTEIEQLLTGRMTEEDFTRNKRQVAQATYKNWAELLNDPTMTMEKIVKPWKDMAAQVLELDPTQIDMTNPKFSVAYAGTPDGKMGAMSLGDWYVKLRSDATYGWDKTTQAKQEAQELAFNIAKSFGKV